MRGSWNIAASRRRIAGLVFAIALVLSTPSARAYEEQNTLELGPVFGVAAGGDGAALGAGVELGFTWGLDQAWSIGASTRYIWHRRDSSAHLLVPSLELVWQLDLVAWVPRIGVGAGPAIALDARPEVDVDTYLRIGVDRLVESGLIGIDLRTDVYGVGSMTGAGRVEVSLVVRWGFVFERF